MFHHPDLEMNRYVGMRLIPLFQGVIAVENIVVADYVSEAVAVAAADADDFEIVVSAVLVDSNLSTKTFVFCFICRLE